MRAASLATVAAIGPSSGSLRCLRTTAWAPASTSRSEHARTPNSHTGSAQGARGANQSAGPLSRGVNASGAVETTVGSTVRVAGMQRLSAVSALGQDERRDDGKSGHQSQGRTTHDVTSVSARTTHRDQRAPEQQTDNGILPERMEECGVEGVGGDTHFLSPSNRSRSFSIVSRSSADGLRVPTA